ncbi:chromodomain Y-like protein 2 isoform X1 [Phacochoerus africanus]|uniref:chromodomain Y-like protein 2 isoform X1 n=1 Tax=Phacochoerus africanus TaxID=41426 RepID=UPI001FDA8FDD|nr:chromodomain Y-like protein 2 isoform X1 [Phacochoerus africanus]
MASGDLYEVERIVDKRRNKKGKWEYLIRWKGYGSTEDTWEPEHHLLHCEEFIDEFNGLHLAKDKRLKSGKQASTSKVLRDSRGPSVEKLSHRPSESSKSKGTSHKRKRITPSLTKPKKGYSAKPPAGGDRAAKTVSYRTTPSGLQIMPLKKAQNGMENGDAGSEKDERHLGNGSHQPGLDVNDAGEQDLGDCDVSPAALAENGLGSALTNGGLNLHSPVKRKLETEKDYVFDKRLRYSVRQNESNCRFRDIVVRKEEGFTHILLSSQTSDNNALTPEGLREGLYPVQEAHRGGDQWAGAGPGRLHPAPVRHCVGQREGLVPDPLRHHPPDARRLLLLHLPPDPGRGAGQRDALLRAEAHRPGGVQQRTGVAGLLADHVQPGGHAAGEGDGLVQRGGAGGVEMPGPELPEVSAGRCERERMPHAQAALELLQRPGFPVQLPAGQNLPSLRASAHLPQCSGAPTSSSALCFRNQSTAYAWPRSLSRYSFHTALDQIPCKVHAVWCILAMSHVGVRLRERWKWKGGYS